MLRRIHGPIQDKGTWRPRWNSEIYNLYKYLNIVDDFKTRRLGWAGHVIRMGDGKILKKILNGKFHNKRPVGKPRTRWEDVVRTDSSQILGLRGWRRPAEDKEEWRRLLRNARAHKVWTDGTFVVENCDVYDINVENTVQPDRPQNTIWRMGIA
jgi:hypothetical protein